MQTKLTTTASPPVPVTAVKDISIERIVALAIQGLSTREIAKLVECDHSNIVRRLQPHRDYIEAVKQYQNNEVPFILHKEVSVLSAITGNQPLSDKHRAATWSMLLDKRRLISGQSTANVSVIEDLGPEARQVIQDAIAAFHRQILPRDPSGSDTVDQIDAPSQSGETP